MAIDLATLERRGAGGGEPRLRFDKVATRVIERLRAALGESVPDGKAVLLTITAPVRLPSRTAASLEDLIRIRSPGDLFKGAPKLIGFVHHADTDPLLLLNLTREWLGLGRAEAGRRAPGAGRRAPAAAGERWLVVTSPRESSCLEAYRSIQAQLQVPTDGEKLVLVFGDGRVGLLTGSSSQLRGPAPGAPRVARVARGAARRSRRA